MREGPMTIKELADVAENTLVWDPHQPIMRYVGAVRQLVSESRVYQREGDYDRAFVYCCKIYKLTDDLLPSRHPDYPELAPKYKAQLRKDADTVAVQLTTIKRALLHRSESYSETLRSPSPLPPLTSSSSSLTLKNTVQPSTHLMTTSPATRDAELLAQSAPAAEKVTRTGRLKKAFGVGKKGKGKEPLPGQAAPGSIEERSDGEWTHVAPVEQPERRRRVLQRPSHEPGEFEQPARRGTQSTGSSGTMPMPGEGGSDDETLEQEPPTGIAYAPAPGYGAHWTAPPYSTLTLTAPTWTPPVDVYEQLQNSLQHHALPAPPAQLQRSASRLTTTHQQQQGYSPSPLACSPPPPLLVRAQPSYGFPPPPHLPPNAPYALVPQQIATVAAFYPSAPPSPSYPRAPPVRPLAPPSLKPAFPSQPPSFRPPSYNSPPPAPMTFPFAPPSAALPTKLIRSGSLAALPLSLTSRSSSRNHSRGAVIADAPEEDEILSLTEGGQPLRNVVLPASLPSAFVEFARSNTERGIETCGLLMGTLSHNTFTITSLLIPKQTGTPDTCTTTHEEEQFAYQDQRDLMTLGWIHTHPTQSCFMSSLDLHTHASYQVMLAEAVAIVCAPRHEPTFGVFRLTDPPGLETIVSCQLPGSFHPHPDFPIYTDTDHGHVQIRTKARFESCDLRA